MKKTYKIDVDCANCANKMEEAAKNTAGVKDATVNFMMLKMIVEFEEGQDPEQLLEITATSIHFLLYVDSFRQTAFTKNRAKL